MSEAYILDACAILTLLKNENGADVVDSILVEAKNDNCAVSVNKINLLEVYYGFYREDGKEFADRQIRAIRESVIKIIDEISDEVFVEAGRLKATYKISVADSIASAQTLVSDGILLTSDHHEFDAVEKMENIRFGWIR